MQNNFEMDPCQGLLATFIGSLILNIDCITKWMDAKSQKSCNLPLR
jgi:hypothetical protein